MVYLLNVCVFDKSEGNLFNVIGMSEDKTQPGLVGF